MSTLDEYRARFARLHTDRNRVRWTAETQHRAPHKPFLLLAVMDLIAHGKLATNFISFTPELRDAFDLYWARCFGPERPRGNPVLPYFHLRSDGFWHLLPVPGQEATLAQLRQVSAITQLKALVLGVALDPALYDLLSAASSRAELRRVLLETYFTPEARSRVAEAAQLVGDTLQYGQTLLGRVHERFALEAPTADQQYRAEARSVAFRRIVVEAYAHACALCGVRLLTPEGRTAVVAAHIVPWRVTHNDDPRNGLALCGLHHWTFDEGLVTVDRSYAVKVSPVVRDDEGSVVLRQLAGVSLRLPTDPALVPAPEALNWHADHVFRARATARLL
jgi:putative restriction endonuclease